MEGEDYVEEAEKEEGKFCGDYDNNEEEELDVDNDSNALTLKPHGEPSSQPYTEQRWKAHAESLSPDALVPRRPLGRLQRGVRPRDADEVGRVRDARQGPVEDRQGQPMPDAGAAAGQQGLRRPAVRARVVHVRVVGGEWGGGKEGVGWPAPFLLPSI